MNTLPKISQPLFELTIPSTESKAKFRQFTVKEEKILLVAQESKDIDQITLAIKQVINNCFVDLDISSLAMFDFEYMLLSLRAKSVSDLIQFKITDPETEEEVELELDLDKHVTVNRSDNHTKIIEVSEGIFLNMEYPKFDMIEKLSKIDNNERQSVIFDVMMDCISQVVQGDEVYNLKDFSKDEVNDFIEGLTTDTVKKINQDFFLSIPKVRIEIPYTTSTGESKTFIAEGTETFFV